MARELRFTTLYKTLHTPKRYYMPGDITKSTDVEVRALQSYWTSQLSYLYVTYGIYKAKQGRYEKIVEDLDKILFARLYDKQKSRKSIEYVRGLVRADSRYMQAVSKLLSYQEYAEVLSNYIKAAEKLVATASREQTWREREYEKYFGRQGANDKPVGKNWQYKGQEENADS